MEHDKYNPDESDSKSEVDYYEIKRELNPDGILSEFKRFVRHNPENTGKIHEENWFTFVVIGFFAAMPPVVAVWCLFIVTGFAFIDFANTDCFFTERKVPVEEGDT